MSSAIESPVPQADADDRPRHGDAPHHHESDPYPAGVSATRRDDAQGDTPRDRDHREQGDEAVQDADVEQPQWAEQRGEDDGHRGRMRGVRDRRQCAVYPAAATAVGGGRGPGSIAAAPDVVPVALRRRILQRVIGRMLGGVIGNAKSFAHILRIFSGAARSAGVYMNR